MEDAQIEDVTREVEAKDLEITATETHPQQRPQTKTPNKAETSGTKKPASPLPQWSPVRLVHRVQVTRTSNSLKISAEIRPLQGTTDEATVLSTETLSVPLIEAVEVVVEAKIRVVSITTVTVVILLIGDMTMSTETIKVKEAKNLCLRGSRGPEIT